MNIHRRATIRPPVEVWRLYKSSTQDRAKLFYDPGIIAVGYDVVLAPFARKLPQSPQMTASNVSLAYSAITAITEQMMRNSLPKPLMCTVKNRSSIVGQL